MYRKPTKTKRQQQESNLRTGTVSDFKSDALNHSAMLPVLLAFVSIEVPPRYERGAQPMS
jgi:hypothetical protein